MAPENNMAFDHIPQPPLSIKTTVVNLYKMDVNWCKLGEGNKLYFILFYSFLIEGMQSVTWLQASVVDPDPHRSAMIWLSWIRIIIPDPQHWINYTGIYWQCCGSIFIESGSRLHGECGFETLHNGHTGFTGKAYSPREKYKQNATEIWVEVPVAQKKEEIDICSISSELKINYCQQS